MNNYYIGGIILVSIILFYILFMRSREGQTIISSPRPVATSIISSLFSQSPPPPPVGYSYTYAVDFRGTKHVVNMVNNYTGDIAPLLIDDKGMLISGPTPPLCCYYTYGLDYDIQTARRSIIIKNMVNIKTGKIIQILNIPLKNFGTDPKLINIGKG